MKLGNVYRITNPKGKIYIGCTIDYNRRLSEYRRLNMKGQVKLFNSVKKYGFENHKFEIIEEVEESLLSEKEKYYILFYNSIKEGLNIRLGNRNGSLTEETKIKISRALKGRKVTWNTPGPKGYKYTEEQLEKMRKPRKNMKRRGRMVPNRIVDEIRKKYITNKYTKSELMREYNVSWGTIKNIVDRINSYDY